jgi:hypothetical protein
MFLSKTLITVDFRVNINFSIYFSEFLNTFAIAWAKNEKNAYF